LVFNPPPPPSPCGGYGYLCFWFLTHPPPLGVGMDILCVFGLGPPPSPLPGVGMGINWYYSFNRVEREKTGVLLKEHIFNVEKEYFR